MTIPKSELSTLEGDVAQLRRALMELLELHDQVVTLVEHRYGLQRPELILLNGGVTE